MYLLTNSLHNNNKRGAKRAAILFYKEPAVYPPRYKRTNTAPNIIFQNYHLVQDLPMVLQAYVGFCCLKIFSRFK